MEFFFFFFNYYYYNFNEYPANFNWLKLKETEPAKESKRGQQ